MQYVLRYILITILFISAFGFVEQSAMATTVTPESAANTVVDQVTVEAMASSDHLESAITSEATTEHGGPHIPTPKGEIIEGWTIGGLQITNTIFSTWIFMSILFVVTAFMYAAIVTRSLPRLRAFGLDIVARILAYATSLLGDSEIAKKYMWLLGGLIVVIFAGNLTGLIFDWLVLISKDEWLGHYLRPIYSDLSTTLVFSLTVILVAQLTAFYLKGPLNHLGHYLFNYHGDTTAEKIVGVFVGWLHFAGEFIRIGSLSMRLFLNIFV